MLTQNKYRHLFFDLDHTLWDFDSNARSTLEELYAKLELGTRGVHDFSLFHTKYLEHNERLWEKYRKGEIRQEELRTKRMSLSLLEFKIADDLLAKEMGALFLELLPTRNILFPGTLETLGYLHEKGYRLHLITNGFEATQHHKLQYSGLKPFFTEVITSEGSNSLKPQKEIFEYAFRKTGATPAESIMIGDSMEVDILGAVNAGMHQVHINYLSRERMALPNQSFPTHTIYQLDELREIL
jgi:putative hydrolase of the HAD superfamily